MGSCKSEYEERLEEAKVLKEQIHLVQVNHHLLPEAHLEDEIELLETKIYFHAKVSGNEELFLKEVFGEAIRD